MPDNRNFLLGKGENLTQPVIIRPGGDEKNRPYTLEEAKKKLVPRLQEVTKSILSLPDGACPRNEAVAIFTLHPQFISKSDYPSDLLQTTQLRAVGSRSQIIRPRKWTLKDPPERAATTEIFVAGERARFERFLHGVEAWTEVTPGASDLVKIEDIRFSSTGERLRNIPPKASNLLLEAVLHAGTKPRAFYVLEGFRDYLASLSLEVDLDKRIDAGDLSFLPVRIGRELSSDTMAAISDMATFSFLRLARDMPRIRQLGPTALTRGSTTSRIQVRIPDGPPLRPDLTVAVFDGGAADIAEFQGTVTRIDVDGVGKPDPEFVFHGTAVTSALLFGPLDPDQVAARPYCKVHHYRVLDEQAKSDPQENSYTVLKRIVAVLEKTKYRFVNLSIGPDMPMEDDTINPWTAKMDEFMARDDVLATIAVGNGGELDAPSGLNRIQPPGDSINGLAVGACDSLDPVWARAPYSCVGPGRSPGWVKPDGLAFGGLSETAPYWVIDAINPALAVPVQGTSFAAPTAMRSAIGVSAILGDALSSLALKTLLIHFCERYEILPQSQAEIGWGRFPADVERLLTAA